MLTRCPQCATTFRVTPEQLKVRQGRVRCGECQEVFSALDTLVEAIPLPPTAEPAEQRVDEPAAAATVGADRSVEMLTVAEADAVPALTDTAVELPAEPAARAEPSPAVAPQPPVAASHEPLFHEKPRGLVWPWALGAIVATGLFAAQTALHFRTEIGILYPAAKPTLVAVCAAIGCELSLPHKSDLMGIEASDLYPDPAGKLMLAATLKNRAPFAQEYPHLELTLTDTADRALVRRVLAPADYLPPAAAVAAGFAANADVAVVLAVDAPGITAAGYRLYLFYP